MKGWTLAKTKTRLHVHNVVILLVARQDHQVQERPCKTSLAASEKNTIQDTRYGWWWRVRLHCLATRWRRWCRDLVDKTAGLLFHKMGRFAHQTFQPQIY